MSVEIKFERGFVFDFDYYKIKGKIYKLKGVNAEGHLVFQLSDK